MDVYQAVDRQSATVAPPDELMLFCGMAIGYRDPERAPLEETVSLIGWNT